MLFFSLQQQPSNTFQVDLTKIAGKTFPEVEQVLGKITREEEFESRDSHCLCKRLYFLHDKLSIVFIDNKADWVMAYKPVEIINMEKTKVMMYGRSKNYVTLKLTSMKNDACCISL